MAGLQDDDGGPTTGPDEQSQQVVDFGWEPDKPLDGRRAKAAKDKKRKMKPGSFGAPYNTPQCKPSAKCPRFEHC
jgi:hypothetical protein